MIEKQQITYRFEFRVNEMPFIFDIPAETKKEALTNLHMILFNIMGDIKVEIEKEV